MFFWTGPWVPLNLVTNGAGPVSLRSGLAPGGEFDSTRPYETFSHRRWSTAEET